MRFSMDVLGLIATSKRIRLPANAGEIESMPIYVYEVVQDDSDENAVPTGEPETFEILQSMKDEPLQFHPTTGQRIRRVIGSVNVAGLWSDMKTAARLSDKNLADKGFTKYVKAGDGKYEKRTGKGPDVISRD
jgi:predicted nucleic acid-binding Zn ribbon protein